MNRTSFILIGLAIVSGLARMGPVEASVTVVLSHHNLSPERIAVHVGDIVTWRSEGGERIELRFDLHPQAHEVTSRGGEVRAFFRKPGEHSYSGRITDGRRFQGLVSVRDRDGSSPGMPEAVCDPSRTLCIVP